MRKSKNIVGNGIDGIIRNIVMKMMLRKVKMRMRRRMEINGRNDGGIRRSIGKMMWRSGKRNGESIDIIEGSDFCWSF